MTDLRKAAEMALEALDGLSEPYDVLKAKEALRQALAQPDWTTDTPVPPFKYLDFAEYKGTGEDVKIKHSLAQPEQRENRMTDREAIQKALDTPHRRYSIKPHGNGYAIYRDRDLFHHGFNIGHLTEVTPETIELIENALNTTLSQPEQEPVAYLDAVDNKTVYVAPNRKRWLDSHEDKEWLQFHYDHCHDTPLYTAPPSKSEQEPVACHIDKITGNCKCRKADLTYDCPAYYTTPPSKPWVSLTDREIEKAIVSTTPSFKPDDVAQAIEAALRSKNT